MTTYVTENMICDCCGGVVLGETYIQNRYPRTKLDADSMHVTGDICEECRPVLQEAFDNIAELQRMKRGPQEAELPEAKAMRLQEENEMLKKQIPANAKPYTPAKPYGAPEHTTAQEMMYQMKLAELERKRLEAMYPQVNYGASVTVSEAIGPDICEKSVLKRIA